MNDLRKNPWLRRAAFAASLAGVVGVASWALAAPGKNAADQHARGDATVPHEAIREASELSRAFSHAANQVRPSVVSIQSIKHVRLDGGSGANPGDGWQLWQGPGGDLLRRFFEQQPDSQRGDREPRRFRQPSPRSFDQQGLGSGFIVSADGYILTNSHVAGDADRLSVRLHDGSTHAAKLVGKDETTDLAVIKIDGKNLPAASFGDSSALDPGQWVLALGAPFGLSDTLTVGVVSAINRGNVNLARFEDFIQTDAAINPGNSGGPLIDLDGDVIGINTAIASNNGGFMGVGFAIPSNMARSIMEKLIAHGKVTHGMMGVVVQPLDQDLAASFGFTGTDGVVVSEVMPDSPAQAAGIEVGDIITKFGDHRVASANDLRNQVAMTDPSTKVDVELVRKGKHVTKTVEVGELTRTGGEAKLGQAPNAADENELGLGLSLQNLSKEAASELGYDEGMRGVLIESVDPDGLGARAGLHQGDVILEVHDQQVKDVRQFSQELKKRDLSQGVRLLVQSGAGRHYVVLKQLD